MEQALLDCIFARTLRNKQGCLLWLLLDKRIKFNQKVYPIDRTVYESVHGKLEPSRRPVRTCGNYECIEPTHMLLSEQRWRLHHTVKRKYQYLAKMFYQDRFYYPSEVYRMVKPPFSYACFYKRVKRMTIEEALTTPRLIPVRGKKNVLYRSRTTIS
jgi:hypothetical protein